MDVRFEQKRRLYADVLSVSLSGTHVDEWLPKVERYKIEYHKRNNKRVYGYFYIDFRYSDSVQLSICHATRGSDLVVYLAHSRRHGRGGEFNLHQVDASRWSPDCSVVSAVDFRCQ